MVTGGWQAYEAITPTIKISGSSASVPFGFPFSLKNGWLPIANIRAQCVVNKARVGVGAVINTEVINIKADIDSPVTLAVRDQRNLRCPIRIPGAALNNAQITVVVSYSIVSIPWSIGEKYSWVAAGSDSKWIEGH
jgi:hypothetical protein